MNRLQRALVKAYEDGYRVVNGIAYRPNGEALKGTPDRYGYINIKPNKDTPVYIHRLLAYQKWGKKIFDHDVECRHLDGNKQNNMDENIALGDHSRNMMDIPVDERRINAGNQSRKHPHSEIIEFYSKVRLWILPLGIKIIGVEKESM
jgi:hypothetical protein